MKTRVDIDVEMLESSSRTIIAKNDTARSSQVVSRVKGIREETGEGKIFPDIIS